MSAHRCIWYVSSKKKKVQLKYTGRKKAEKLHGTQTLRLTEYGFHQNQANSYKDLSLSSEKSCKQNIQISAL